MGFDNDKKNALYKLRGHDKSNIGAVDRQVRNTVDTINRKKDYYTTSSCAGRIVILDLGKTSKKSEANFLFRAHSKVVQTDLEKHLADKRNVWFRQEPAILHIIARSLDGASKLLDIARDTGFKHSGIQTMKKRIVVEVRGSEFINAPLHKNMNLAYQKMLVKKANESLEKTRENLTTFTEKITTELS